MNLSFDKNSSCDCSRITVQEKSLVQFFESEGFSFVFQKSFSLPDRSYVVDFFLDSCLFLECSHTSSSQYPLVFRSKAILLESKASYLQRFYPFPMCVLFESSYSFGPKLISTLTSLMPSVSYFFTSRQDLFDSLRAILDEVRSRRLSSSGPSIPSEPPSLGCSSFDQQSYNSVLESFSPGIIPNSRSNSDRPSHNHNDPSPRSNSFPILSKDNYSHDLKKESSECFLNSWEVLI
ncbi:MAG: hypothetical protein ACTSPG_01725 [Candidatus Hodarchaeales archaeon]